MNYNKKIEDFKLSDFRKVKLKLNNLDKIDQDNRYWRLKLGNLLKYKDLSMKHELKCQKCSKKDVLDIEFHHIEQENGQRKGGVTHQEQIREELKIKGYWKNMALLCSDCHNKVHK